MTKKSRKTLAALIVLCQLVIMVPVNALADTGQPASPDLEISEINFPDKNFRSWLTDPGNINGAGTDLILTAGEIAEISNIDISAQGIGDLRGIEYFTSLESLNCSGNYLKSLDLKHNTLLTELYCSNNQLSSLDLSVNTALETLYCAANFITSLDISRCSALISLNCEKNKLTEIDLSGNPRLVKLYSRHNLLTQLDVSSNRELKFIETFDNFITSFDCTMLPDLEFLHIDYNRLTTLDMSKNPALKGNGFVAANNQLDTLVLPDIEGSTVEASVFYEQNPREGYEYVKWFYDQNYSREISPEDILETSGQTVYAKWIANPYTVYYRANGGEGSMDPQTYEYGTTFTLAPNTFTRTGFTFKNWNTHSNGINGQTYSDREEVNSLAGKNPNNSSVDLYAQWTPNIYTIRYDANGGEGSMDDTSAEYGRNLLLSPNKYTREDHIFTGWSLSPGDDNTAVYLPEENVLNLTSENGGTIILYAVWMSNAQLRQTYISQLNQFFRNFSSDNYYEEDWLKITAAYNGAYTEIEGAGSDENKMKTALQDAVKIMDSSASIAERIAEISDGWSGAHTKVLEHLYKPVPAEETSIYTHLASAALEDAETGNLISYSTLQDEKSRQHAADAASEKIGGTAGQLRALLAAAGWMDSSADLHSLPLSSVRSSDYETYKSITDNYNLLSEDAKIYCDPFVLAQVSERKSFALEKKTAVIELNEYFSSFDAADYTETDMERLREIARLALEDIENAGFPGEPMQLLAEARSSMDEIHPMSGSHEDSSSGSGNSDPDSNPGSSVPPHPDDISESGAANGTDGEQSEITSDSPASVKEDSAAVPAGDKSNLIFWCASALLSSAVIYLLSMQKRKK